MKEIHSMLPSYPQKWKIVFFVGVFRVLQKPKYCGWKSLMSERFLTPTCTPVFSRAVILLEFACVRSFCKSPWATCQDAKCNVLAPTFNDLRLVLAHYRCHTMNCIYYHIGSERRANFRNWHQVQHKIVRKSAYQCANVLQSWCVRSLLQCVKWAPYVSNTHNTHEDNRPGIQPHHIQQVPCKNSQPLVFCELKTVKIDFSCFSRTKSGACVCICLHISTAERASACVCAF